MTADEARALVERLEDLGKLEAGGSTDAETLEQIRQLCRRLRSSEWGTGYVRQATRDIENLADIFFSERRHRTFDTEERAGLEVVHGHLRRATARLREAIRSATRPSEGETG
jgi:hypothetical protein